VNRADLIAAKSHMFLFLRFNMRDQSLGWLKWEMEAAAVVAA